MNTEILFSIFFKNAFNMFGLGSGLVLFWEPSSDCIRWWLTSYYITLILKKCIITNSKYQKCICYWLLYFLLDYNSFPELQSGKGKEKGDASVNGPSETIACYLRSHGMKISL
jgi:hypothetical protein